MRTGILALLLFVADVRAAEEVTTATPMIVDAANRTVGYLASHHCNHDYNEPTVAFISATGYAGCISASSGRVGARLGPPGIPAIIGDDLSFSSPDCSGQAFICGQTAPGMGGFMVRTRRGITYAAHGQISAWTTLHSVSMVGHVDECMPRGTPSQVQCFYASAFDLQILGVQSSRYRPPLRIAVVDDSTLHDVIFFDGMDDRPEPGWQ